MCGEDRGPIVPAYSSRRRPKINICSKEFQHIFPFGTDQRKATGNLLFVLKSSEAIIETFPKTMSSWEIPFPLMIIWGIKPRLCWEDVWGILLKVCLPSSRLTWCQPDRVVCWPEESWPEVAHMARVDISPRSAPTSHLLHTSTSNSICATHISQFKQSRFLKQWPTHIHCIPWVKHAALGVQFKHARYNQSGILYAHVWLHLVIGYPVLNGLYTKLACSWMLFHALLANYWH